jgi:hypothetical protein
VFSIKLLACLAGNVAVSALSVVRGKRATKTFFVLMPFLRPWHLASAASSAAV